MYFSGSVEVGGVMFVSIRFVWLIGDGQLLFFWYGCLCGDGGSFWFGVVGI